MHGAIEACLPPQSGMYACLSAYMHAWTCMHSCMRGYAWIHAFLPLWSHRGMEKKFNLLHQMGHGGIQGCRAAKNGPLYTFNLPRLKVVFCFFKVIFQHFQIIAQHQSLAGTITFNSILSFQFLVWHLFSFTPPLSPDQISH